MTDQEINIAIAEVCGWKWRKASTIERILQLGTVKVITTKPNGVELCGYIPNYCNDLNAMHEAENVLKKCQRKGLHTLIF